MDPLSTAVAFVALAAGSLVKGITGLGLPVVALPVLSYFLGLPHAIGVLILPIVLTNLLQSIQTRAAAGEVTFLWPMLLLGIPGIAGGTWVLVMLPVEMLNLGLGLMLFLYIGLRLFRPQFSLRPRTGFYMAPPVGLLAGFVQGATGLCAAVFVPYVHVMKLNRVAMIFAISTIFLVFSIVQFTSLLVAGLFESHYLLEGLVALVPVALFMPLGSWIGRRLSREIFDRGFLVILALIGAGLIESAICGRAMLPGSADRHGLRGTCSCASDHSFSPPAPAGGMVGNACGTNDIEHRTTRAKHP